MFVTLLLYLCIEINLVAILGELWYTYVHMENKNKAPKRLAINIDEDLHKKIKILATRRNMTISQYVLQAVIFRIEQDKER